MTTTDDRNDPRLSEIRDDGQQEAYLVLSEEERAKGFVRPLRMAYEHVGVRPDPEHDTRPLTDEEKERFGDEFALYEIYPPVEGPGVTGKFWTQEQLESGCGSITTIGQSIAETYARSPSFYGATFCVKCGTHFPVEQFVWVGTNERVGS